MFGLCANEVRHISLACLSHSLAEHVSNPRIGDVIFVFRVRRFCRVFCPTVLIRVEVFEIVFCFCCNVKDKRADQTSEPISPLTAPRRTTTYSTTLEKHDNKLI